jgi:hypothetical protein
MKKYLSGLLTGIIVSLSITVFAAEFNIIPNPYPILIDGVQTEVEGYNIDGSTFLKLKAFEKAGLEIAFENNNILINTQSKETSTLKTSSIIDEDINVDNDEESLTNDFPEGFKIFPIKRNQTYKGLPSGAKFIEFKNFNFPIKYNDDIYIDSKDLTLINLVGSGGAKYSNNTLSIRLILKERKGVYEADLSDGDYFQVYGHYYVKYSLFKEYE